MRSARPVPLRLVVVNVIVLLSLIMLLGPTGPARAEEGDAPRLMHEVQVLSPGRVRVTLRPLVPQPSPQDLNAALEGSGWEVARVGRSRNWGVALDLAMAEPPARLRPAWVLRLPVEEIAAAVAPDRVVGDLRLILPNIVQPDWLGSAPSAERQDKASFTTFILDPGLPALEVALEPRVDFSFLALRALAWAVFPVAASWLFAHWILSRSSAYGPGKLHPAYHAWMPLVMLTTMPFQNYYQQWFLYWPEWYLRYRWLVAVGGFLPLVIVIGLSAYPALRIALEVTRGMHPDERATSYRLAVAKRMPAIVWAAVNFFLLVTPLRDLVLTARSRALVFEVLLLAAAVLVSPALIRRMLRPVPLSGPAAEPVLRLVKEAGVSIKGICLIPGRTSSPFLSAVVVGFPPFQRMLLIAEDSLHEFETDEVRAVVAHQIGRLRLRHSLRRVLVLLGAALALNAVSPHLSAVLGRDPLLLVMVSLSLVYLVYAAVSRRHEYEADRFAARMAGVGPVLGTLNRLAEHSREPGRWGRRLWWLLTHPPVASRVQRLMAAR